MKRKLIKFALAVIFLLVLAGGYLFYVFTDYHRLPDNLTLEVEQSGSSSHFKDTGKLQSGSFYWIMTYNLGYGAYRREYSFFMDGGKSSRAKDKETVMAGISGMGEIISNVNPDIVLLQEADRDGTRSYHVDELELINEFVKGYYYVFAQNYDSPYLFYPPWEPHGKNKSGLITYSRFAISDTLRRSLPVAEDFRKILDLDRCYSVSRLPVDNGKSLCIYNTHLSAYGTSKELREEQIRMLCNDMLADYRKGNYVICGGDYNQNIKDSGKPDDPDWATAFPKELLPEELHLAIEDAKPEDTVHNSCRTAAEPYNEDTTFTVTIDGFIVSDNITVNYYANMDWRYEYSDHDPVLMQFYLNE